MGQNGQLILLRVESGCPLGNLIFNDLEALQVESGCPLGNLIFNDLEALRKNDVIILTTWFSVTG